MVTVVEFNISGKFLQFWTSCDTFCWILLFVRTQCIYYIRELSVFFTHQVALSVSFEASSSKHQMSAACLCRLFKQRGRGWGKTTHQSCKSPRTNDFDLIIIWGRGFSHAISAFILVYSLKFFLCLRLRYLRHIPLPLSPLFLSDCPVCLSVSLRLHIDRK